MTLRGPRAVRRSWARSSRNSCLPVRPRTSSCGSRPRCHGRCHTLPDEPVGKVSVKLVNANCGYRALGASASPAKILDKMLGSERRKVPRSHGPESVTNLRTSLSRRFGTLNQTKARPKLRMQRLGVVANHPETTALRRTFQPESADDHVPSRLHRPGGLPDIGGTVARLSLAWPRASPQRSQAPNVRVARNPPVVTPRSFEPSPRFQARCLCHES